MPDWKISHINIVAQNELHINISTSKKYQNNDLYITDLFYLIHEGKDILPSILQELIQSKHNVDLPSNCCVQGKLSNTFFPIKGQLFHFQLEENISEIIFYFHNTTQELSQEYILNTALMRSKIYPWFLDIDRSIFVIDPRYFEYLGIEKGSNNSLTMETYTNMVHPDDRQALAKAFSIQLSGEVVYDKPVSFRLKRGDGTWEWFEGQSTYIGKLSGLPYRLVGICMSIQEHKNIEESLITARNKAEESDRLKSGFLANMSHEIRTPLNAIVGFSEVLSTIYEELTQEERTDYVELIQKNSAQLLVLISDILDLSKIESNSMEFVFTHHSLNDIFTDIYKSQNLRINKNIIFKLTLPDENIMINTDITRLKQVLNNLINNAIKFTSSGCIQLGFRIIEGNKVNLFVEDTGEGISQEHLNHIFDRFYKVDSFKQGTGLGLAICKTIIECLYGEISVSSVSKQGTCFNIMLPLGVQISSIIAS